MHAGAVLAAAAASYALRAGDPLSVLLGGAVMGANFALLRIIAAYACSAAARPGRPRRAALAVAAFVLKFALFLALLAAVFLRLPVEGLSFAAGATPLLVAFVIEALRNDHRVLAEGVG